MSSNRYLDPFQSGRTRAMVLVALVGIGMVLDVAGVATQLSQASLLSGLSAGRAVLPGEAQANDARVQLVALLTLLVFVVTVVAFLIWFHRAHKNPSSFGAPGLEYSPGWAVGGFFVPFLNLIRPFQVMREIWKASDPEADPQIAHSWQYSSTSPLIAAWWGTWILSGVLGRLLFSFSKGASDVDSLLSLTYLSITSFAINLVPAALLILLIRAIDRRQQEKHERLTAYWAQQSAQEAQTEPAPPGA
jgi:Domain of unknown function (DUF4328)